jgi:hypothetical protein
MAHPSFGRSKAERGLDQFDSPPAALIPLLVNEPLLTGVRAVAEPFAGAGNLVTAMRQRGIVVHASDIVARGCPDCAVFDFFDMDRAPCDVLISNPPYASATDCLEHAWAIGFRVIAFLLDTNFLHTADRYERVHKPGRLKRVHVFAGRLQDMHDANHTGPRASQSRTHIWCAFDRDHYGPATISPISLQQPDARMPWADNGAVIGVRAGVGAGNGADNSYRGPRGTSRGYVLSRLARGGRADLTARVESGELSVRAALRLVQGQPL